MSNSNKNLNNGLTFYLFQGISSYPQLKMLSPDSKLQTLWIFGDSQAERLYLSIKEGPLCKEIFKTCNLTKMWTYAWPRITPVAWDDKDFDPQKVIDLVRRVLENPEMNENSAMVLNLGLHYIESTSLTNYRELLNGVIDLLNERNNETGDLRHKARIIWKTVTSMNKEKDTASRLKSDWQRFLNLPVRRLRNSKVSPQPSHALCSPCFTLQIHMARTICNILLKEAQAESRGSKILTT